MSREDQKRREAERRNARHAATRELKQRTDKLERELGKAEAKVSELQRLLADPEVYADNDKVKDLVRRHEEAKDAASKLMDAWMTASEELERVERSVR